MRKRNVQLRLKSCGYFGEGNDKDIDIFFMYYENFNKVNSNPNERIERTRLYTGWGWKENNKKQPARLGISVLLRKWRLKRLRLMTKSFIGMNLLCEMVSINSL